MAWWRSAVLAAAVVSMAGTAVAADKKYGPGASDSEIKLGQTMPYSGPASAYGTLGRAQAAYFAMINEKGGVNGRKIRLFSVDDAFSPPKTVEATRQLVEQEQVLAMVNSVGSAAQAAVQRYLNMRKVPQLFVTAGSSRWNNPKDYPWTTMILPMYSTEARVYAKYILANKPDAKIAILSENDEFGRDYLHAFKDGLGDKAKTMIVKEVTYELADPSVDSQIIALAATNADVFVNFSLGKATSQAIRKVNEIGWNPLHLLASTSTSSPLIRAAGPERAVGIVTAYYAKHVSNPAWADDPDVIAYQEFRQKYLPNTDPGDDLALSGYAFGYVVTAVLEKAGDDLTRENLLKQATSIQGLRSPQLLPGITYNITPDDYAPIKQLHMMRYDGKNWVVSPELVSAD